jgi:hypothetical protein
MQWLCQLTESNIAAFCVNRNDGGEKRCAERGEGSIVPAPRQDIQKHDSYVGVQSQIERKPSQSSFKSR